MAHTRERTVEACACLPAPMMMMMMMNGRVLREQLQNISDLFFLFYELSWAHPLTFSFFFLQMCFCLSRTKQLPPVSLAFVICPITDLPLLFIDAENQHQLPDASV